MQTKNEIRIMNKKLRNELETDKAELMSSIAADAFVKSDLYKSAKTIMLYMPLGKETDTTDIINKAFEDGKRVCFPITDAESVEITAYYAEKDTSFKKGAFSVFEPQNMNEVNAENIDVVVVPGIAFDKRGARVGFGKGCYDRFLKKCNAIKVGFCYDFQICDEISVDEHDIFMDYIVSESGIMEI